MCGYVFYPCVWLIGVPPVEIGLAARLISKKTILNEFLAFTEFSSMINLRKTSPLMTRCNEQYEIEWPSERTEVILTYA